MGKSKQTESKQPEQDLRKLFFVGAGGGGKSTFLMLMIAIALWKGILIEFFDCDPANPTTQRYYKQIPEEFDPLGG